MKVRSSPETLKAAGRDFVKEAVWFLLNRHQQGGKKNICLFSSRRSGSTLLMQVIAANKGVKFVDQPFSFYTASSGQILHLPVFELSQFVHLDNPETQEKVRIYLTKIFEGEIQVKAPWRFWTKDFHFVSNRIVLKILDAKGIIDWIDKNFSVHIIYSTRHPIPVARSIIRNQWGLTAQAYLKDEFFVRTYLGESKERYCHDVLKNGTLLQQHVLNWGLENMIPLRLLPERPHWLYLSYEEFVTDPQASASKIAEFAQLDNLPAMMKRIRKPSVSTRKLSTPETRKMIEKRDKGYILQRWRKEISEEDERGAFEVLRNLDISLYTYGEYMPTHQ